MEEDDIGNLEEEDFIEIKVEEQKAQNQNNPQNQNILPQNQNNSCFLDTLLMALFFNRHIFLDFCFLHAILQNEQSQTKWIFGTNSKLDLDKRKEVQKLLKKIIKSIRQEGLKTNESISNLRELLSQCNFKALKNVSIQQEAMECLYILLEILQLNTDFNLQITQVFGTNDLLHAIPTDIIETTNRNENISCVCHITQWDNNDNYDNLLSTNMDSGILKEGFLSSMKLYQRQLTKIQYIPKNSFFMIHIDRTLRCAPKIDNTPLILKQTFNLFELRSVILHKGKEIHSGHYSCLLKDQKNQWCLFDDTIKNLEIFNNFDHAIEKTNANENCVLLLFTK